jgi:hypothetical protein
MVGLDLGFAFDHFTVIYLPFYVDLVMLSFFYSPHVQLPGPST